MSSTQSVVALSSGEAELNACLKAAAEGMFVQQVNGEMGQQGVLTWCGDSSASRGILLREGSSPLKHLDVKQLWAQEKVVKKDIHVIKLPRAQNAADALTHHWSGEAAGHYHSFGLRRVVV